MRKQKKYHYIYKTVNILSGKYYIGMHSTDNLDDGYLGSGTRLRYSINKHGKDNHIKEIIEYCNSREELKARETEVVNLNEIAKVECMNLRVGGEGGAQAPEIQRKWIDAGKKAYLKRWNEDEELRKKITETLISATKKNHKEGKYNYNTFKGKKHSEETKNKMSEVMKGKGKGSKNSQFGKRWVTNEIESKKINKEDLIPEGWRLGRN